MIWNIALWLNSVAIDTSNVRRMRRILSAMMLEDEDEGSYSNRNNLLFYVCMADNKLPCSDEYFIAVRSKLCTFKLLSCIFGSGFSEEVCSESFGNPLEDPQKSHLSTQNQFEFATELFDRAQFELDQILNPYEAQIRFD